jgi:hypothetical protein
MGVPKGVGRVLYSFSGHAETACHGRCAIPVQSSTVSWAGMKSFRHKCRTVRKGITTGCAVIQELG